MFGVQGGTVPGWAPNLSENVLAWENSRHFATRPLVSPRNDVITYYQNNLECLKVFLPPPPPATTHTPKKEKQDKTKQRNKSYDFTAFFPTKRRLSNEHRNSVLMKGHYRDLGSASDWSCSNKNLLQPVMTSTGIWVVTCHQYWISVVVAQASFCGEKSGEVLRFISLFCFVLFFFFGGVCGGGGVGGGGGGGIP